ncbi:hypothetical protein GSI_05483 [Ganoderma sinense ZZ0214-1]|uniref:Uncharacterized protein n=1 Tax=Ganoderma sinense ZZ0214-1 TaxID=1077348 RepID=A0A2G8SF82_9APHY|nr:hypothetical protein GSI_05483 [Ganoderma sinense ZZ0214-1]
MVSVSEAVEAAQSVEESIIQLATVGDREIIKLRHLYHLPARTEKWAAELGLRLSMYNKDYRRNIKVELMAAELRLQWLYVRHTAEPDALQPLFKTLQDAASAHPTNRPQTRAFLQRSTSRLESGAASLRETDAVIHARFSEWKDYFKVVCVEDQLRQCLLALHDSKVHRVSFYEQALPLMNRLVEFRDERERLSIALTTMAYLDATTWTVGGEDDIPLHELTSRITTYEGFRVKIQKVNDDQVAVIAAIEELVEAAKITPRTLPGHDGKPLSVGMLVKVFNEYECLCALSARALEAAEDEVLPALRSAVEEIRLV